jgi:hypothetical protein
VVFEMIKYLGAFLCVLILVGCQTGRELPALGTGAVTRTGQLRYAANQRSFIGDVILRTEPNGDYDLDFSKAGVSILRMQVHGDRFSATGSFARGGWSGSAGNAPRPLRSWALLRQVLPFFNSDPIQASNHDLWQARFTRKGKTLKAVQIGFAQGDSMLFNFAQ